MSRSSGALALGAGALALGAVGAHVWARHVEIHRYTLREHTLPILPAGARTVRLLHISDIHLMPDQDRKLAFLRHLAALRPHLVIDTGDNIASAAAIGPLGRALDPLLHCPGAFVMGSNDMYAPSPKNPLRYFLPDPRPQGFTDSARDPELPTEALRELLGAHGWADLTNTRATIRLPGLDVELAGVDDPHLERDEFPPPVTASAGDVPVLRLGVAHAPYLRVLDAFAADGADLVLAGHTHGGQLRLPGIGALVTNCDLPRSQARGLSDRDGMALHVSGGLGASPYSNFRTFNPPEATLLTLRASDRT